MTEFEIIETINPPPDAMVRSFHCQICDKQHLQIGEIVRIWVKYQEGYASQAAPECCGIEKQVDFNPATMTRATDEDIARIWNQLWGDSTVLYIMGRFEVESGEYLDKTQRKIITPNQ